MQKKFQISNFRFQITETISNFKSEIFCGFLVCTVVFILPLVANASSLSDLNTKGFQEHARPAVRATENPFLRQNVSPEDILVEDLHLTGIIYNSNEAFALISGYTVKEGDVIAGFKVKVVEKDHVVLRQLDQVKVLRLE